MQKGRTYMHKFDYSFLNNGMLPSQLVNITASISSLKTASQFRKNDYEKIFTELEKIAKIQSVKSSNEIEGIITTDERIVQIVQQNSAPLNHNEEEILGYRDALNIIHTGYQNIQFNENTVLSLQFLRKKLRLQWNNSFLPLCKQIPTLI